MKPVTGFTLCYYYYYYFRYSLIYLFIFVVFNQGTTTISSSNEGEFSVIQVKVRFYRRYTFYLLTLYIPTVLLILIAYATFFFNPDDFNSRVVVAVTSLLVLTSLLTQVRTPQAVGTKSV